MRNFTDDPRGRRLAVYLASFPEDLASRAFAEAFHQRRLDEWTNLYGLKRSSSSVVDISRLWSKRGARGKYVRPPGADHESLWLLDGTPTLYVMQPYGLDIHTLTPWCVEYGLRARVDTWPAWHFPAHVVHVELATVDGWARLEAAREQRRLNPRRPIP